VTTSLLDRIAYTRPYQLRSGWRIALFLLAGLAASNLGIPILGAMLPAAIMPWLRSSLECAAVLLATRYATRSLEGVGWEGVGLGRAAWQPRRLAAAGLTGALAIGLPTAAVVGLGALSFVPAPAGSAGRDLLFALAILAPAALTEELLFRGYPFAVLSGRWGWPVATGVSSVLFGLLHTGNPGVTPMAIANVIAAGVFLAGIRIVTDSLAAAWAAHFAWNWTMSAGFHVAVSGLPFGTPSYRLVDTGPDWLSGGAWGPEGGLLSAVGMMGAFAGLAWATGRMRPAGAVPGGDTISLHRGAPTGHQEHDV
jgi:uncharacterized protein